VAPGDTLWLISAKHYGRGWLFLRIYWANRRKIRDPDVIYPCERLFVPRLGR
jgi:nucleoid-associated protein YgaU